METLLHISNLNLHPAAVHKMAFQLHIIVSIFISRNFPFSVHLPLEVIVGVGIKNVCGHLRLDHIGQGLFV